MTRICVAHVLCGTGVGPTDRTSSPVSVPGGRAQRSIPPLGAGVGVVKGSSYTPNPTALTERNVEAAAWRWLRDDGAFDDIASSISRIPSRPFANAWRRLMCRLGLGWKPGAALDGCAFFIDDMPLNVGHAAERIARDRAGSTPLWSSDDA